jgi:hypothetical protein
VGTQKRFTGGAEEGNELTVRMSGMMVSLVEKSTNPSAVIELIGRHRDARAAMVYPTRVLGNVKKM